MEKFVIDIIKQRRLEMKLSQQELAERSNVNVKTISRIENGKSNSTLLPFIMKALDIDLTESNPEKIISEHKNYNKPNVKTGTDLATHIILDTNEKRKV